MNTQERAVMQQALDALLYSQKAIDDAPEDKWGAHESAISALRQAMAVPALQLAAPVSDDEADAALRVATICGNTIGPKEMRRALEGLAAGRAAVVEPTGSKTPGKAADRQEFGLSGQVFAGVEPEGWRDLAQRCLEAMNDVVRFRETGCGRPPEQTCIDAAADLTTMLSAQPKPAVVEPGSWQPMETAPVDGTNVLLINDKGNMAAGMWLNGALGTGWFLRGGNEPDYFFNNHRGPTHWMPLPQPPAATA